MECPACGKQLQQMTAGDVTVDVCKGGCGGMWFDNYELKKFDEPHESAGEYNRRPYKTVKVSEVR